jgi:hypothetical protein
VIGKRPLGHSRRLDDVANARASEPARLHHPEAFGQIFLRCDGLGTILAADTEVQCAAISQATTIIPDTSTIVRPWVSSQRRAWRRALRPCDDERLSASRPARPLSVGSIAPPWRKGRLNGLRSSLVLMAQIDAIVVNFGRYS